MHLEILYTECPHCGKWFSHLQIISMRGFHKKECWSDGNCVHLSLIFPYMLFSQCNECEKLFWFDDCRQIKDYEIGVHGIESSNSADDCKEHIQNGNNETHKDFFKANPDFCDGKKLPILQHGAHFLEISKNGIIKKYFSALQEAGTNIEREIYIRTEVWQLINDFEREYEKSGFKFFRKRTSKYRGNDKLRIENLEKLSELIKKTERFESQDIALIEIERELGNFEKAKSLIENLDVTDKHNFELFLKMSKKMIAKKSTKVFKLE